MGIEASLLNPRLALPNMLQTQAVCWGAQETALRLLHLYQRRGLHPAHGGYGRREGQ
jgi:hypothetical protein